MLLNTYHLLTYSVASIHLSHGRVNNGEGSGATNSSTKTTEEQRKILKGDTYTIFINYLHHASSFLIRILQEKYSLNFTRYFRLIIIFRKWEKFEVQKILDQAGSRHLYLN